MNDNKRELTPRQHKFICEYVSNGGNKTRACKAVGMSRGTIYLWLADEDFKAELEEAEASFADEILVALRARAIEKSDMASFFLLKAFDPTMYDDNVRNRKYIEDMAREIVDEVFVQAEVIPQAETVPDYDS